MKSKTEDAKFVPVQKGSIEFGVMSPVKNQCFRFDKQFHNYSLSGQRQTGSRGATATTLSRTRKNRTL